MQKKNKKKKNWKKDWKTKHSRVAIALLAGFFALCSGCARKPDVQMSGVAFEEADTAAGADADEKNAEVQGEENASVLQGSPGSFERNKAAEPAVPESAEPASEEEMSQTERVIYVHVCGAVQHPGVYPMAEGTRVYEAVALAGGFLPEADEQWLNQAAVIGDAQKLYVYSKEESETDGNGTGQRQLVWWRGSCTKSGNGRRCGGILNRRGRSGGSEYGIKGRTDDASRNR